MDRQPPTTPQPRKGMPERQLDRATFLERYRTAFADPAFRPHDEAIAAIAGVAWDAYAQGRKAPHTRKAGADFADPDYDLAVDWLRAREAIAEAEARHDNPAEPLSLLLVNGSPRTEHTCPGEMSKSWRLIEIAAAAARETPGLETEILDLSRTTSEYGRTIHPCKACFSTSPALCHWPCSCYPNHALGQVHDWMNEIYPLWVRAHGVMIVTPVNWYQVTSPIKLMMDRLVCADGGNPDPTLTHGKNAEEAKRIELEGWNYLRHLAGRFFAVVVHGDVEGVDDVRRAVTDWLSYMHLRPASPTAEVGRYIGYWQPYATNHQALDEDTAIQEETANAARALAAAVAADRAGRLPDPAKGLTEPRQK